MATFQDWHIDCHESGSGSQDVKCPVCSDSRRKKNIKSLTIYHNQGNDGQWRCHHCGSYGYKDSGWQYVNPGYTSLVKETKVMGKEVVYNKPKPLPEANESEAMYRHVFEFFKERGISWPTCRENDIRWGKAWFPQLDAESSAIIFPYKRDGEVVNAKYRGKDRSTKQKIFTQVKGAEKIVFGLDTIRGKKEIIITEGEMDKMSFDEAGLDFACSVPDGAPHPDAKNYSSKFDYLKCLEAVLKAATKVYLAVDSDLPGKVLEEELARRIGKHRCYRIRYPDGCKDTNEVLLKHGVQGVKDLIKHAQPYPIDGVYRINDFASETDDWYEHGIQKGQSTGYANVDEFYTVKEGMYTVVTGIPKSGKSVFIKNVLASLAMNAGWRIGVFDWENSPPSRFIKVMSEIVVGKPFDLFKNGRMSEQEYAVAKHFLQDKFFMIHNDDYEMPTLDSVLDKAAQTVSKFGIKALLIDPFNALAFEESSNLPYDQLMNIQNKKMVKFSRTFGCHVFCIAHPRTMVSDAKGNIKKPTAYDINGGAAWFNSADNVIVVHRFDKDGIMADIFIDKVKFEECGKTGKAHLNFNIATKRYYGVGGMNVGKMGLVNQATHKFEEDDGDAPF